MVSFPVVDISAVAGGDGGLTLSCSAASEGQVTGYFLPAGSDPEVGSSPTRRQVRAALSSSPTEFPTVGRLLLLKRN